MNEDLQLEENVIAAWVRLTGLLKNTRLTKGMIYNEAIVMMIVNRKYEKDGVGSVSFKDIVTETGMLKSLVNRTIDSLVRKGMLVRSDGELDRRTTFVRPVPENLSTYLAVHERTLDIVKRIIALIGKKDAETFVRLADKITAANL